MVLSPAFTFGVAVATFYGLLAHLLTGGDGRVLLVYILSSWIGFSIGQGVGQVMSITALSVGQVYMLPATLGSVIALITTAILALRRIPPPDSG